MSKLRFRRSFLALVQMVAFLGLGMVLQLAGCSANDPFDPEILENIPPVVRMSMAPVDPGQELNPTSYYDRLFNWSATDQDGWVTEFYISIRTDASVPAPWDTTTRTDTTMTFSPDDNGYAEATFLLACRDNRGAVSDTLMQFIPFRNFPPAVNFQSDFDPLKNLQRELRDINGDITEDPGAAVDTTYWNWGAMNFRMFALDLDGRETMDSFYRYTLKDTAEGDPEITFEAGDPEADPNIGWIRAPFPLTTAEVVEYQIFVKNAPPGIETTLTVSVADEAFSDTRFHYTWEVREPSGPVLFVPDNLPPVTKIFYREFLAGEYGSGSWDEYSFWFGYPDHSFVLLETMRKFEAVLWAGGGTSAQLVAAAQPDGALSQYLFPTEDQAPGGLLLISKGVVGTNSTLPNSFLHQVLGISATPRPVAPITTVAGKQALGQQPYLPPMTSANNFGAGVGLKIIEDDEENPLGSVLYQMEFCDGCYGNRPPHDPIVGVRFPDWTTSPVARSVTLGIQLEYFNQAEANAGLSAILSHELGVAGK